MSRIYWHARNRTAELHGSERGHLEHVACGPAVAAYDLDVTSLHAIHRAAELLALVPEPPAGEHGANYLHRDLRAALAEERRSTGSFDPEPSRRLIRGLRTGLRARGLDLVVAGVHLRTANLDLNTALVAGSDPVRLAAKLNGWCEQHCWVEGPDRKWLADIIDEGLRTGLYRRGFWYVGEVTNMPAKDHPNRKWSDQGWDDVLALLRESDDGPVVLSYSVTDGFPNSKIAGWEPPPMPDGWEPDWADTEEGHAEWERDYPTPEDKAAHYLDTAGDQWYDLPEEERWDMAMAGLRGRRPWAQLAPHTLTEYYFGIPVTVYDLFAPDRDERVLRAADLG